MPCPRQRERPPNLRCISHPIQFPWVSTVANQLRQIPQIPGIPATQSLKPLAGIEGPFEPKTVSGQTKQLGMSSSGWQLGVFCITLLKSVFFSSVSLKKSYHLSISISMHCPHESIHLLKLKQKTTTTEDSSILRFVHWIFSRPQQKLSSKAAAQESKNRWALTSLKETWSWSDPKRLPALFHVANDFFWRCDFYLKKWKKSMLHAFC